MLLSPYLVLLAMTGSTCAQSISPMLPSSIVSSSDLIETSACSLPTSIYEVPTEHNVTVGAAGTLSFDPNEVDADIGDIIRFSFLALNHTLTQSSLSDPCTSSGTFSTGFNQFNPENVSGEFLVEYWVNTRDPQWFFCAQTDPKSHCKSGMVFALNAGGKLQAFASAATETTILAEASSTFYISLDLVSTLQNSESRAFSTTSSIAAATTVEVTTVQATSSLQSSEASNRTSASVFTGTGTQNRVAMASAFLCLLAMFFLL